MSIYTNKGSPIWWISISRPDRPRIRRSTGTADKKAAQEYHDKVAAEIWRQDKIGEAPERLFSDAALRVLKMSRGQKDYASKVRHIRYWRNAFQGRALCSLTAEDIFNSLPTHQLYGGKDKRKPRVLSPATQNRYLATMSRILTVAEDAGWIVKKPKIEKFRENQVRVRWITKEQANLFLGFFGTQWMRDICTFALSTGARRGEILHLEWSQVDLKRKIAWVTADKAKSGKARPIPLNAEAVAILKSRQELDKQWVFTRDTGVHTSDINRKSFNLAAKKAGLKDFHFHDLRHTWASWHVQAGTPLFVLKEMGGWENLEMVKKYAHLSADHLTIHANGVMFLSRLAQNTIVSNKKAAFEAA